jgi:hypothetical protein
LAFFSPWQVYTEYMASDVPAASTGSSSHNPMPVHFVACALLLPMALRGYGWHGRASLGVSLVMPSRDGLGHSVWHFMALSDETTSPPLTLTDQHLDLLIDSPPVPWTATNSDLTPTPARLLSCSQGVPFVFRHRPDGHGGWEYETRSNLSAWCGEILRNIDARPDDNGRKMDVVLSPITILGTRRRRDRLSSINSIVVVLWLWLSRAQPRDKISTTDRCKFPRQSLETLVTTSLSYLAIPGQGRGRLEASSSFNSPKRTAWAHKDLDLHVPVGRPFDPARPRSGPAARGKSSRKDTYNPLPAFPSHATR